jgi:RimJ/RimL family protein N-acetyltransferase
VDLRNPASAAAGIPVTGPRLALRPLRPEIDEQWQAMVTAGPNGTPRVPDEARFRARLRRSGQLVDGWIDLAIDLDGAAIGRIQTFVPEDRPLPAGTFEVGIGLRESQRGKGYGREAVTLLTGWLFEHAGAQAVQAPTDPANVAMRTVFDRAGWTLAGTVSDYGGGSCTGLPGRSGRPDPRPVRRARRPCRRCSSR